MTKHIKLAGMPNTRDMGGFAADGGRRISYGRLIRSGELYHIDDAGAELLADSYSPLLIIDFRTPAECALRPDPPVRGAKNVRLPVLDEATLGITDEGRSSRPLLERLCESGVDPGDYMRNMYLSIANSAPARRSYAEFFRLLAKKREGAALWHCTAGKDRAGMGAAFLLAALGVSKDDIFADYIETDRYIADVRDMLVSRAEVFGSYAASATRAFCGVDISYIKTVFDSLEADFGSALGFITEGLGVSGDTLSAMRDNYLE